MMQVSDDVTTDDTINVVDTDALIGVHCTHGVNRTGYLICSYLIKTLLWSADSAVSGTFRVHMHLLYAFDVTSQSHDPFLLQSLLDVVAIQSRGRIMSKIY